MFDIPSYKVEVDYIVTTYIVNFLWNLLLCFGYLFPWAEIPWKVGSFYNHVGACYLFDYPDTYYAGNVGVY